MDFTYGLAQALAVKDNRIFSLEKKRTELYAEIDRLQHIIEQRDIEIAELKETGLKNYDNNDEVCS